MIVCMLQAQCLYDFEGDTENGELSFYSGDVLTIIRQVTLFYTSVSFSVSFSHSSGAV